MDSIELDFMPHNRVVGLYGHLLAPTCTVVDLSEKILGRGNFALP